MLKDVENNHTPHNEETNLIKTRPVNGKVKLKNSNNQSHKEKRYGGRVVKSTAVNAKKRKNKNGSQPAQKCLIGNSPITFNIVLNNLTKKFGIDISQAIKEVVDFHDKMIKNHSVVEGTARFNDIRLYAIGLLEGRNVPSPERVAVGKKDRWPSAFNLLRPLYYRTRDEGCRISDRVIRSILYLNRLCEGNGTPDFTEIRRAFGVPLEFRNRYQNYVNKHVEVAKLELITKPSTRVLSNGPNGKPKWMTADVEAYALLNSKLNEPFKRLCMATGNADLYKYIEARAATQDRVTRKRLRYITTVRDSGNKCRLVAISDYWTQVLLEPVMLDIQTYIKQRFKGVSYSHCHAQGFENLKKFIKPGIKSYDIKSWTDAFPAILQFDFMCARYGKPIAEAWYDLVVTCEWNVKRSKDTIKYERGQGMGTNGSFDIATITDLFLLEMVYKEDYQMNLKKVPFNKVGDDLWCFDPDGKVYDTYTIMCGIDINQSKTKNATEGNLCGEFVSRNINYGYDVSRISAKICRAVHKNILDVPQLACHLEERNYESVIPLQEIFKHEGLKEKHVLNLLRTFFLLCSLYQGRTGMKLLKNSIKESFPEFYYEDEIVVRVKTYGISYFKDSFNVFAVKHLLKSISDKSAAIFDSATEFDSSDILSQRAQPDMWWLSTDEPIGLLTSKTIMARSFGALNSLWSAPTFEESANVVDELTKVDQAMTFKELGVISTTGEVWRPKTTKLYNLVKNLVVQVALSPHDRDHVVVTNEFSEIVPDVVSKVILPYGDPIFGGTNPKVIGQQSETIPAT
jgi:hypothetical protein